MNSIYYVSGKRKGQIKDSYLHYVREIENLLKNEKSDLKIRTCYWTRSKGHMKLVDKTDKYIDCLDAMHITYEIGNDAPRGGQEGNYILIERK